MSNVPGVSEGLCFTVTDGAVRDKQAERACSSNFR